jgi:type IV pilus assembly protein PilN
MKIPINLASQPFRRDRAMLLASAAVSVALVATLGLLVYLAMLDRAQLSDLRKDIARLNQQIRVVTAQQTQADAVLHRPENAEVLERSLFINNLLVYKAVSWSRLFSDLEKTVPYNVKVLALHPSVNAESKVLLDMTAGAESPEALIQFLRALEMSPRFGEVNEHNLLTPSQSEPLYRCHVTVNYAQEL